MADKNNTRRITAMKAASELLHGHEKRAGYYSELASMLNPLNAYGATVGGGIGALTTPTRTMTEQATHDRKGIRQVLLDLLVPGVGPYHAFKRHGTSIRGPELKAEKARLKQEAENKSKSKSKDKDKDKNKDKDTVGENPHGPAKSVKAAAELTNSVKEKDEEQKPSWKHYAMGGLGVAGGVGLANLLRFFLMSNSRR